MEIMQKQEATQVLHNLIFHLTEALEELSDVSNKPTTQFAYGEKTAYVECLEWLSEWEQADGHGLNYNIEQRYPL